MENIVINGKLYKCEDGTANEIYQMRKYCSRATKKEHENGTAYMDFNSMLEEIEKSQNGVYLDAIFETY